MLCCNLKQLIKVKHNIYSSIESCEIDNESEANLRRLKMSIIWEPIIRFTRNLGLLRVLDGDF